MIEWSWRLEGKRRIWCGSWSDAECWQRVLPRLRNANVAKVSLTGGRFPEIDVTFEIRLHLVFFMTAEGDSVWDCFPIAMAGLSLWACGQVNSYGR